MYFPDAETKAKALFSNLGKSTLRGVRKCPKCGTYNGTRGLSCKNKSCDVVFKEAGEKKKLSVEVSKLDTGNATRVFSVRVREKGPDHRGFVQLPILDPDLPTESATYLSQVTALCFVDTCQRLFNANILKCHEKHSPAEITCSHILSALQCGVDAVPLNIDYEVLHALNFLDSVKEEIWQMASETTAPVVQRVSKSVMAVRCKLTTKNPLGFLHVSFVAFPRLKENHFACACSAATINTKRVVNRSTTCLHYFACLAAFASDSKCSEEFANYIVSEANSSGTLIAVQHCLNEMNVEGPLVAILSDGGADSTQDAVEVEVFHKDLLLTDIVQNFEGLAQSMESTDGLNGGVGDQPFGLVMKHHSRQAINRKVQRKKPKAVKMKTPSSGKKDSLSKDMRAQLGISLEPVVESNANHSFVEWLASVTERINQTMHYGFSGKPEPLVFQAPHVFFECFLERLTGFSGCSKRKQLPNLVTSFARKAAPPLGIFHNFTWHVANIIHAKVIFDTPVIQLDVSKSFFINLDGKYEEIDSQKSHQLEDSTRSQGQPPLKPVEYMTYLKIGHTSPDQTSPSVLTIDWTPNVLPLSRIGELKIKFEYGHTHPVVSER